MKKIVFVFVLLIGSATFFNFAVAAEKPSPGNTEEITVSVDFKFEAIKNFVESGNMTMGTPPFLNFIVYNSYESGGEVNADFYVDGVQVGGSYNIPPGTSSGIGRPVYSAQNFSMQVCGEYPPGEGDPIICNLYFRYRPGGYGTPYQDVCYWLNEQVASCPHGSNYPCSLDR